MSPFLKIAYSTAIDCIQKANELKPNAIIIGTAKGSLHDTEIFNRAIRDFHETALNATNFINSTYNQLNGMIALNQKISSYNNTFVQRGFSLEHAFIDAQLFLADNPNCNVLVGSYDEMSTENYAIKSNWEYWKEEDIESNNLFLNSHSKGSIAGEGAHFFLISDKKNILENSISISSISTLYKPSEIDFEQTLENILQQNSLTKEDISIVLNGFNGDKDNWCFTNKIETMIPTCNQYFFKHLCGDYETSTGFAIWLAHSILTTQIVPTQLWKHGNQTILNKKLKHILVYNNFHSTNQSLLLLTLEN